MKNSKILSRCLVSGMILSSLAMTANATEPVECGMPLDVYEATSNPVPEGVVYEYTTDENGNFVLVGEENSDNFATVVDEGRLECGMPLDVYEATSNPVPEGTVYEYTTDENGNFVLVEESEAMDLTEAFDPEGEPMPEETFASPSGNTNNANWFTRLMDSIFSLFTR